MATSIHPTAIVDKAAQLGEGVVVGAFATIEPDVVIGDHCRIGTGAIIRRYSSLGPGNVVDAYCVLGGVPQDYKFDAGSQTYLRIGAENVFREYVTLSRATTPGGATVIGSHCYFMTAAHVGHDSVIADRVVLTNGAAVGGHAEVGRGAILSAHAVVHQFCWVGELVIGRGNSGASQHVPPFVMFKDINHVVGLNRVGLRRAEHISDRDREQIKEAYRILYRSSLGMEAALKEMDGRDDWGPAAGRFRDFVRRVLLAEPPFDRGLATARAAQRRSAWPDSGQEQ